MNKPSFTKKAVEFLQKVGWSKLLITPEQIIEAKKYSSKNTQRKWTDDVKKRFELRSYGQTHLSKRHYIERERLENPDGDKNKQHKKDRPPGWKYG